ncbi:hypothetical protein HOY82DRAFT_82038 [Tuber indicum]|nr:hypothetical protein HOY82DRAFT_82038 [Tuber indicum]
MPSADRSAWRNAFIYASNNRGTILGGLWVAEGITNANLYSMLEIFCFFSDTFNLQNESEQLVERDMQPLQPGNYYIVTNGSITITDETPLIRTTSLPFGTRVASFRDAVRDRDRRCIISGWPARLSQFGNWTGFETAHIFPLAHEEYWNDHKYSRWITIPPAIESDGSINSVQNGILVTSVMRDFFESYDLTINPDDNYKIVFFTPDSLDYHFAGHHLDQSFLDNPFRPVDQLLRWHFRQAVLVNMKGAGEPCFETDFPPGSDFVGEIMSGFKGGERMEFELFSRFNAIRDPA